MPRPRTLDDRAVLAATARAMAARGPARLTLGDIAAEAGLAPSTLLQRFGSKRGLLLAVSQAAAPDARERFARAGETQSDPLEALVAVFVGVVAGISREQMAHHVAFLGVDISDAEFRALAAAQAADLRAGAAELLADAMDAGLMRPGSDAEGLARSVYLMFNGSLIAWALDDERSIEDALRADLDALLAPYRTEAAT